MCAVFNERCKLGIIKQSEKSDECLAEQAKCRHCKGKETKVLHNIVLFMLLKFMDSPRQKVSARLCVICIEVSVPCAIGGNRAVNSYINHKFLMCEAMGGENHDRFATRAVKRVGVNPSFVHLRR